MSHPISAVLITFNSERVLAQVLAALEWCDEILIVDSGSHDETIAIAERFGCRIIHQPFLGFGPQKRFAVNQAHYNWVLVADADEVVTPALRDEILQMLTRPGPELPAGFNVPVSLVFLGRLMVGGESKRPQRRLFDRRRGNFNSNMVHEDVILPEPVPHLAHEILHYSYGSIHEYFEKFNRYTTVGATQMHKAGRKAPLWRLIFRFPFSFIREYVVKLNFLNGYAGFIWSLFSAMYPVVKYAKLREMVQFGPPSAPKPITVTSKS